MSARSLTDGPALAGDGGARRCHAFGLQLDVRDGIATPDLTAGGGTGLAPPTVVRLAEAGELDSRWPAERATVTRELRHGPRVVLTAEHVEGVGYLLTVPEWGRFLVAADGLDVGCEPATAAWAWGLAAQVLPLAATLRGREPFHASGVVAGGAALMISAPPGLGKTSLAVHLVGQGADLLTDDVVVLDDDLFAYPGSRWLHVRPAEAERLEHLYEGRLRHVSGRDDRVGLEAPFAQAGAPLAAIYLLARGDGDGAAITALDPAPPTSLLGATYNLSVREPARLRRQLDLCQRLAEQVPVFVVEIRPGIDAATLAAHVAEHFDGVRGARCDR